MMKSYHAGTLALVLCLAACAGFDQTINNAVAWIDAPATQQAIGSLKSGVLAFTCAVADASAVAKEIESGVGAGQSLIGTDGKVYTASAATCAALGGTLGPQVVVP